MHLAEAKCSLGWGTVVVRGERCCAGQRERAGAPLAGSRSFGRPGKAGRVEVPQPQPSACAPCCTGMLANMLVCLAVWLANSARDAAGKILGIYLPIMSFTAIGC